MSALRNSMADLITRTRLLINDPAGASQVFSDEDIQDTLDRRRMEQNECALAWRPETAPGGTVSYHDFYAPRGDWEDSAILKDRTYAVITPDTADYITGHWTFVANQVPPVFITGVTYDLAGSAYDLLDMWASKVALEFDFQTDNQQFERSQKRSALLSLAAEYARRIRPHGRSAWRADVGEW